jgi:hypothetical protein
VSSIYLEFQGSPHNVLVFHQDQEQECIPFLLEVKEVDKEQELALRLKDLPNLFPQSCKGEEVD